MINVKIESIHVTNFKSFKEFNFDFKKINVILGPNNSGKSNILRLLLLLKQTFTSSLKSPLILNGSIINLGSYKDITYKFNGRKIGIDFRIQSPSDELFPELFMDEYENNFYDLKFNYSLDEKLNKIYLSEGKIQNLRGQYPIIDFQKDKRLIIYNRSKEKFLSKFNKNINDLILLLDSIPDYPTYFSRFDHTIRLPLKNDDILIDSTSDLKEAFDSYKKIFQRFASSQWDFKVDYNRKFINFNNSISRDFEAIYGIKRINDVLNNSLIGEDESNEIKGIVRNCVKLTNRIIELYEEFKRVNSHLIRMEDDFSTYFNGIHYIGPTREPHKRFYSIAGESVKSVGSKGEFLPYLLKKSKEELDFRDNKLKDLDKKIQKWLVKFELAKRTEIKQHKEIELISILLQEYFSGVRVNLHDMGFGTIHVLPIIIESIISDRDPLLMIEEPAVHLHPKAQSTLGDLFIEIANEDKTIIVETHSEHLIRRIQRRIAENIISKEDVIFYYVKIGKEGSELQELRIDEDGFIENIPEGFFDENYEEASEHLRIISEKNKKKK